MIPNQISQEHVLLALEQIDQQGIPPNRESRKFHLHHNGRPYPPKYVISLASQYATGRALPPKEFTGGEETNRFLRNLGFRVE